MAISGGHTPPVDQIIPYKDDKYKQKTVILNRRHTDFQSELGVCKYLSIID
jgi:hypothetical protein